MNVSLSAERVLESLEEKGEGNDSMSSGEENENVSWHVNSITARGIVFYRLAAACFKLPVFDFFI